MPTYAILGGTGNTGGELIELLAHESDVVLHIYARSKSKLLDAHPFLADPSTPHKLFIGDLADEELFTRCLQHTSAVFGVVGTNANNPNLKLAERLATVIIAALTKLRGECLQTKDSFQPPTTVFVTSAGMSSDKRVRANFPGYLVWMGQRVGKYIFMDFREAMRLFQKTENAWIPIVFFCAPGLMPGPSQGEIKIGFEIPKNAPVYVTYADLARGMVQAVAEEKEWVGKEIGIAGAKMPPVHARVAMYYVSTGLLCTWAPPVWRLGNRRGWWGDH